eukprot:CAMPEP_0204313868 /NCGR_PEP_ID=MMETSP0469-20131031/3869_1 /ASSEMBLY_ACC=CAM_ASM_000384 /TAXON_ID=2969 /ORGANISM="Oxyrrhis marina" /LENGTH=66 /DNA_ID=CAMNT_0051294255 /DNA_START=114 /DNA_END=314 /DNA_ORIENTATION=+
MYATIGQFMHETQVSLPSSFGGFNPTLGATTAPCVLRRSSCSLCKYLAARDLGAMNGSSTPSGTQG